MKTFLIIIIILISSSAFASLPAKISRFQPALNTGDIISALDYTNNLSSLNAVILGERILDQYHPEIQITVTDGSELLTFELQMNLTNSDSTAALFAYNFGIPIIQYVEFTLISETSSTSIWSPSYIHHAVELTDLSPTVLPLTLTAFKSAVSLLPLASSSIDLTPIIIRLDKLIGDPANDTLVPEALRGKISSAQYMTLMAVSGLLSAFIIFQIWSRAF